MKLSYWEDGEWKTVSTIGVHITDDRKNGDYILEFTPSPLKAVCRVVTKGFSIERDKN